MFNIVIPIYFPALFKKEDIINKVKKEKQLVLITTNDGCCETEVYI